MADDAGEKGDVPYVLQDLLAPPTIMHYEPEPVTSRQFVRHGERWLVTYRAQHDGAGFLVTDVSCRKLVIEKGTKMHIEVECEEHYGSEIAVTAKCGNSISRMRVNPGAVKYVAPGPG